ncbi:MAG: LysM peptidoglycan-binding domain-containing protein [Nitrospinae bacterium]|nr:LysM peptidoglycan-binding domain-containing protein [Nitrospinota bacterium]
MKPNLIITFLVFLVMTLFVTEVAFAYPRTSGFQVSRSYTKPTQVVHTVKQNESLWAIAKRFDVDFAKLAEINGLDNPDLIFPGNKLVIKIQVDGSIMVMDNVEEEPAMGSLPFNYTPRQVIAHVTYPDKDDLFAPANPVVSYEVIEAVLKPIKKTSRNPIVFKTFEKFVRWLSGSLGYSNDMTQARGQSSFDPPTGPTFLHSGNVSANSNLANAGVIAPFSDKFTSHIADTASPPPKSL